MSDTTSTVHKLFIKPESGMPLQACDSLQLTNDWGIQGNKHGGDTNPRQVLITALESLQHFEINPGQLRENIVTRGIDIDGLKSGQVLRIGEAKIRITFACEPCGFVEKIKPGLLRAIEGRRGMLGIVLEGGEIKLGDEVQLADETFCEIPYKLRDRFSWLVRKIPAGKVLGYTQILEALGTNSPAYYRVLPHFIKQLMHLPVHRVVDSKGYLLDFIPNQSIKLAEEGVEVGEQIDLAKYSWNLTGIYFSS